MNNALGSTHPPNPLDVPPKHCIIHTTHPSYRTCLLTSLVQQSLRGGSIRMESHCLSQQQQQGQQQEGQMHHPLVRMKMSLTGSR